MHIPRVLYHWRDIPGSTARSGGAKPHSFDAGAEAVARALADRGSPAEVSRPAWAERTGSGVFQHDFAEDGPTVTIVIASEREPALVQRCLQSLAATTYLNRHVLVIDGPGCNDEVRRAGALVGCSFVCRDAGAGSVSAAYNDAVKHAAWTEFLLFLDPAIEVLDAGWLSRMIGYACLPGVGAVGARLVRPDRKVRHAGMVLGVDNALAGLAFDGLDQDDPGYLGYAKTTRNTTSVDGACLLTPRTTFILSGGFDSDLYGDTFADVDYCCRLRKMGLRSVYAASAVLHMDAPRGSRDPRAVAAFRKEHRSADPFYSPHLSLERAAFRIQPSRIETDRPRKIRALMCCFNLNWEGAPYSQFEMTRELTRRGVLEPIVYSPCDGPLRAAYEALGIPVHVRPHPLANCATTAEYEAAIEAFCAWTASLHVSLVYGNTLQTFYAIDAAHRLRVGSVWNPRESEPWREYFRGFGPDLEAAALRCFQYPYRVIFVAHATARVYRELDSHHNFCVVHNGLDPAVIAAARRVTDRADARASIGAESRDVVILLLGTVCERKGQLDAIAAWAELPESVVSQARLYVVGDRPSAYSSAVRARHAQLSPERRARATIVPETDAIATYFAAADVFLCTSLVESYPRVVLEAMAWNLPIVTTPVFGIAEQVRADVNALFYDPGNAAMLAQELERIVTDRSMRERFARASADVLGTLNDFEQMADQYARYFEEASLVTHAPPARPAAVATGNAAVHPAALLEKSQPG